MPQAFSLTVLKCDMNRGNAPRFLAYEYVKAPDPEGYRREPKILIFCWPPTVIFPDAPVFHAQPVNTPQSQYGALNVAPDLIIPKVRLALIDGHCMGLQWHMRIS